MMHFVIWNTDSRSTKQDRQRPFIWKHLGEDDRILLLVAGAQFFIPSKVISWSILKEKMKIALAFFGQPRFFGNPEIIKTYKEVVIERYDTDVFGHMWWQEDGGEFDCSSWSTMNSCPIPKDAPNIFKDNYKPVILSVEDPKSFELPPKAKKFIDEQFTDKGESGKYWNPKNYSNVMSQLYSIKSVTNIVKAYSEQNNVSYDFIVLARYDAVLMRFPDLNTCDKYKFYLPGHHPRFPDTIQFFGPKYLTWALNAFDDIEDIYETIWEPSPEAFKMGSFLKWFHHSDLAPCSMDAKFIRS
jgi:hypothetical protein